MLYLLKNALSNFSVSDAIDILIVAFLFYQFFLLIKDTKAYQMTIGLMVLGFAYFLSDVFSLNTFHWLLKEFLTYVIIAIIVLYQGELRKFLAEIGSRRVIRRFRGRTSRENIKEIALACSTLAGMKIGALIAIEKEISLNTYVEKGVVLDAAISRDLLIAIFDPNSPLHDGAVIIQQDRIRAASCLLPHPSDHPLMEELGTRTRHLAALGLSIETDAAVIVVSEEKGTISLAINGSLLRNLDRESLEERLVEYLEL